MVLLFQCTWSSSITIAYCLPLLRMGSSFGSSELSDLVLYILPLTPQKWSIYFRVIRASSLSSRIYKVLDFVYVVSRWEY